MELMKNYKYYLKESSAKTVVFAFGRFQPPTTGHALLVSAVEKTAKANVDSFAKELDLQIKTRKWELQFLASAERKLLKQD